MPVLPSDTESNSLNVLLISMEKERLSTPRRDLHIRYYESVVEQNSRLQLIRHPLLEDFEIVILDKRVAKGSKIIKSHPLAIYLNKSAGKLFLNKSASCSEQSENMNRNLIYQRKASVPKSNEVDKWSVCTNDCQKSLMLEKQEDILKKMNIMNIEPRKRWNKLYDRKTPFRAIQKLLSAEILNKITELRIFPPITGSAKYHKVERLLRKNTAVSRILIYRRYQLTSQREEGRFPLIWNESGSSDVIDEVSGENLSHIALLCRDVICECNNCTTGCIRYEFYCDRCKLDLASEMVLEPDQEFSGSFAEHCMLPSFYLQTDGNPSVKKCSDIDTMLYVEQKIGFDVKESNIIATVDTDQSRPGYLRLRDVVTGQLSVLASRESHDSIMEGSIFDSFDMRDGPHSQHGPATTLTHNIISLFEIDRVLYLNCSLWPPIAKSWIDRKRPSNWPSKETIQTIVSKGCRVVHKPHELSKYKESEMRFSVSEAERILFGTLTCDQRKCFIAFKSLIKYNIYKLQNMTKEEFNLSSYCLKTIFLWACETIPVYHWQTTNGWSKCLLYMIDNLYACVKARKIPGYIIPESNLLDIMKRSRPLLDGVKNLRCNPISYAATFADAIKGFRGIKSKISDEAKILCSDNKMMDIVLIEQLIFLQSIVAETNVIRGCLFWKKEAVLRIFAKWCKQNTKEIRLTLWQCLTNDMTLFDVVYLDIVHGFHVPNDVLVKYYVDKGWSAEFVCRLASCYYNEYDHREFENQEKHSILLKSLLMMQYAFDRDHPTIVTISNCIYTMIKHKEFEIAIRALESGADEMLKSDESIRLDDLDSVVGRKTRNEFQEMSDLINTVKLETKMSVRIFFLYASYVCYKNLDHVEDLHSILKIFSDFYIEYLNWKYLDYSTLILLLEVYEHMSQWRMFHSLYTVYMTFKMQGMKTFANRNNVITKITFNCSCSWRICSSLQLFILFLPFDPALNYFYDYIEAKIKRLIKNTADRMYYAQVLIFKKDTETAKPILNRIIEEEGDYSLSVFICPKTFWELNFLDDNLCKELSKSSADYVVFPTNLYARYLLVNAYNSLGQMEQCERNKTEFRILRHRYSTVVAFAPMLTIVSNIFE